MRIHKEGTVTILITFFALAIINSLIALLLPYIFIYIPLSIISLAFFIIIVRFFRNPPRPVDIDDNNVLCPADGKIVVIEEVEEPEYFKDKRLQISVFMSPYNVHVNRYPISGLIKYFKYHKGEYLVAYHPKSSTQNERTSVVIQKEDGSEILVRQVAGKLARRIVPYSKEGKTVKQGDSLGFIKFGSRVDLYLPLDINIKVKLEQVVTGNVTVIASFTD